LTRQWTESPQFYLTAPAPCPYLDGRMERKVFTHLVGDRAPTLNDILTQGGFRRSQNIAYRPACEGCKACVSVRVVVDKFRWTKAFRRIANLNADLITEEIRPAPSSEQYGLFRRYLARRHASGGMADMSVLDYAMMVEDTHVRTTMVEYRMHDADGGAFGRRREPLVGCALTDVLADGLSMVYSFYEPAADRRSLGTYMILEHIDRAKRHGLPYVYLGYWVRGSPKMGYKERFRPQEHLSHQGWCQVRDG